MLADAGSGPRPDLTVASFEAYLADRARWAAARFPLNQGGHIGYSVRPSARNRGVAGAALGLGLVEAQTMGITPVLLTVRENNLASRRVIERAGGSYEDTRNGFRRYWFTAPHRAP